MRLPGRFWGCLALVALLVFVLMRIMPGDIVLNRYAGEGGGVSEELLQVERIRLGLHHPMWK